jgi:spermidine synthase
VELLENVVEASYEFADYNYDCLADPRVNLITGDGRNHLALTARRYDVIVSHPTNPWISGVGDLFSREYFELAKSRLNPGGIMCAWFQTYHMPVGDLKTAVRTFLNVFEHAALYMSNESDLIILGSSTPLGFDGRLIRRMSDPQISSDLRRVWIDDPADILSAHVVRGENLRRWAGDAGPLHTDDNLHLEFSAGRAVLESSKAEHLADLAGLIEDPPAGPGLEAVAESARVQTAARRMAISASVLKAGGRVGEAMSLYGEAFGLSPGDPFVLHAYVENNQDYGRALLKRTRYEEAALSFRKSIVEPAYPKAWSGFEGLGYCFLAAGEYDSAAVYFGHSVRANPHSADGFFNLGTLELVRGNTAAGAENLSRALEIVPEHAGAANNLARVYARQRSHPEEAVRLAEVAVSADGSAGHYVTLGWAQFEAGNRDAAARALERALEIEPAGSEALYRLALLEADRGNLEEALAILKELLSLGRDDRFTAEGRNLLRQLERGGR